jgi:hypothetical protein
LVCPSDNSLSNGANCHHHFWDIPDYGPASGFADIFDIEIRDSVERILSGCPDNDPTGESIDETADFLCARPIMFFPNAGEGPRPLDAGIAGFAYFFTDLFVVKVGHFV